MKSPQKRSKYNCGKCEQPKNKEHGHMHYNRVWYCTNTESRPYEEWLAEQKRALAEKRRAEAEKKRADPTSKSKLIVSTF